MDVSFISGTGSIVLLMITGTECATSMCLDTELHAVSVRLLRAREFLGVIIMALCISFVAPHLHKILRVPMRVCVSCKDQCNVTLESKTLAPGGPLFIFLGIDSGGYCFWQHTLEFQVGIPGIPGRVHHITVPHRAMQAEETAHAASHQERPHRTFS